MENNAQAQRQNQKGIYALCLGILSCVGSLAYYPGWIFALICGICAIIFSTQVKWNVTNGSAIAGFVLGVHCGTYGQFNQLDEKYFIEQNKSR